MKRYSHLTRQEAIDNIYIPLLQENNDMLVREMCKTDLFFLLVLICKRKDLNRDWLYERCKEVQLNPDGHLDLWARGHGKSSLITFGKTIQDILCNPDIAVVIFSHTKSIAKAFLAQIKREFESNDDLKKLFPDIFHENPGRESPTWSLDSGIIVKRECNKKEATIEAHGVVDSQPTSRHYDLMVYDDLVTLESVSTPDQIAKVRECWELSLNLASEHTKFRYIGTRYHFQDLYSTLLERKTAIPRIYPATCDGTLHGEPVLLTKESLEQKRRDMGSNAFSSQLLLNPLADGIAVFKHEWLSYYYEALNLESMNKYILVDPASSKKQSADYTSILVIGLGTDQNYYLIDGIRDRLNLTERAAKLFDFVRRYKPLKVGYERYGMQSDIEFLKFSMNQQNYRFNIVELGGAMSKTDRIKRLVPIFENMRFYLPVRLLFQDYENKTRDLVSELVNDEFLAFPISVHDDMLDCMARITDSALCPQFPAEIHGYQSYKNDPDRLRWAQEDALRGPKVLTSSWRDRLNSIGSRYKNY